MLLEQLPKGILDYLWQWEYNPKWADGNKSRSLREELKLHGYKITDKDFIDGEYNDLRGYMNFHVKYVGAEGFDDDDDDDDDDELVPITA
jgi:hypothetical protein